MNARIAKKVGRWRGRRYSEAQLDRAEVVQKRAYRREDRSRDVNRYYESRVGTSDGKFEEVYHARVCTVCYHLECPCCPDLDRDHDKCTFALPRKSKPIRVERKAS